MDDLSELERRAEALRTRLSDFIDDLGEIAPPLRDLHADLAEIDEDLQALIGRSSDGHP